MDTFSKRKKHFSLKKILKYLVFFIALSFFVLASSFIKINSLSPYSKILLIIAFFGLMICLFIFLRNSSYTKSSKSAFLIINSMFFATAYIFFRKMYTPGMEDYIFGQWLCADTPAFKSMFRTSFSLGYSFIQFFIGYILSKLGDRLIGLFGLANVVAIIYFINFCDSTTAPFLIFGIQFMIGSFCSCAIVGMSHYIKDAKYSAAKFGLIYNLVHIVLFNFADVIGGQMVGKVTKEEFSNAFYVVAIMFAIPSIVFLVNFFHSKHRKRKEETYFKNVPYITVIKELFVNRKYFVIFIQSILVCIAGAVFRDNFLPQIASNINVDTIPSFIKSFMIDNNGVFDPSMLKEVLKIFIEKGLTLGFVILAVISPLVGNFNTIVLFATFCLFGIIVVAIHAFIGAIGFGLISVAMLTLGLSYMGHVIFQCMIGEEQINPMMSIGLISIVNTSEMLFGATIFGQKIIPVMSYNNAILVVLFFSIVSFVLSIYAYVKYRNVAVHSDSNI